MTFLYASRGDHGVPPHYAKGIMLRPLVIATLASAILVTGCATVGPDYASPALMLPAHWSSPAGDQTEAAPQERAKHLARWWRQLGDAQLDRLIDEALSANTDLRLAQARLRQARASRAQASAAQLPSLTTSGTATRSKSPTATTGGASATGAPNSTLYDAGFDASWEIDLFGATRRAVEAADADTAAAKAAVDAAQVSLLAEVAQTYVDLRSFQRRLAIARENLATQSETLQLVEWRQQAGLATSVDIEQARTNREQTRGGMPDLEVGLAAAENRLTTLLGKHPGTLSEQLAELRALPDVPPNIAAGIPAEVLRQRPDLVAAERTLAAETARLGQRQAERLPSLTLSGGFGWQAFSLGALGGAGTVSRAVGGTLAATLFDGGRLRAAVEVQSAVQEQALVSYERSVLNALEEVENALVGHAATRDRIAARRAAAASARTASQLSRHLFESGLADFQKLLDAERTRLTAEDNLAAAEATLVSSLIKLYKALGGGWEAKTEAMPASPETAKGDKA